jgi:hypothetical protein
MRYMGEPVTLMPSVPTDPNVRAQLLSLAPNVSDTDAEFFSAFTDATPYGHKHMLMRYGVAGAVGLVVGAGVALLLKR